eukprot:g65122.t1
MAISGALLRVSNRPLTVQHLWYDRVCRGAWSPPTTCSIIETLEIRPPENLERLQITRIPGNIQYIKLIHKNINP